MSARPGPGKQESVRPDTRSSGLQGPLR